ncbi:hypothetical protein HY214_02055 [Candidatus Roizmanbacteria bacterium]|nr:hypothetical protein [Candidatus Roizmanbacteria bacterium]
MKSPVRIAVDAGDYHPSQPVKSGIQRLVAEFLRRSRAIPRLRVAGYSFGRGSASFPPAGLKVLPKYLFSEVFLPLAVLRDNNRFFLGFSGHIPFFLRRLPIKKIVFVHDLGFYKYPRLYQNAANAPCNKP